jgi:hypothetical protein
MKNKQNGWIIASMEKEVIKNLHNKKKLLKIFIIKLYNARKGVFVFW